VSALRHQAVRVADDSEAVSGKQRKGSRGASQRVTGEVVGRLKAIRALYFAVMNDPTYSMADLSDEFYSKVGDVLSGMSLSDLTYYRISKTRVLEHAKDA
jgi:hypothetical protein